MFTTDQLHDLHKPHIGMTMDELLALRQAEPLELHHLRRAMLLFARRRALKAKGVKIVGGKRIPIAPKEGDA